MKRNVTEYICDRCEHMELTEGAKPRGWMSIPLIMDIEDNRFDHVELCSRCAIKLEALHGDFMKVAVVEQAETTLRPATDGGDIFDGQERQTEEERS